MRPIPIFLLAAIAAAAQSTVFKQTFETDTDQWMVMGTSGSVKLSKDARSGAGALAFTYSLDGKGLAPAVLPTGQGRLAEMRRIRFWMKSDHDATFAVFLGEKKPGGGDYTASVWAPMNVWQQVNLGLPDFVASDGPNDPVDPDGKLDPDQVEGIGILDLSGFLNQMPAESPMVVARKTGQHTLLIDDFEVLGGGGVPKSSPLVPSPLVIDAFDRGFLQWMTLGGMKLSLASPAGNPIGAPALAAAIQGVDGKLTVMVRRVNGADIAGAKRLAFDIAAEHEGTFTLSIETKTPSSQGGQGPRYNFLIYPPEGRKVFRVNVSLADFEHDANSPEDPAGTLEASRIKSISIGDITALAGGAVADNRIWIGRMEMLK